MASARQLGRPRCEHDPSSMRLGDQHRADFAQPNRVPTRPRGLTPMFRLKIGILDDYQDVARSLADWSSLDADVEVFTAPLGDAEDVIKELADFDVLVAMRERTRFPAEVLSRLRSLKLLVSTGTANSAIDVAAATELGVVVSGTGYFSYPTAELTWALILAAARKLPEQVQSMRTGGWQLGLGTSVQGLTLGVLGLGNVGEQVAAIAHAFGMRVIAWSENLTAARAAEHEVDRRLEGTALRRSRRPIDPHGAE